MTLDIHDIDEYVGGGGESGDDDDEQDKEDGQEEEEDAKRDEPVKSPNRCCEVL